MLSKVISAPIESAATIAASMDDGFTSVDSGGLDSAAFLGLHMLSVGGSLDELLPQFDPVAQHSDNGPWMFAIPSALRDYLAELSQEQISDLSSQWAESDELQDDNVSPSEAAAILMDVASLASRSASEGNALLLWLSL